MRPYGYYDTGVQHAHVVNVKPLLKIEHHNKRRRREEEERRQTDRQTIKLNLRQTFDIHVTQRRPFLTVDARYIYEGRLGLGSGSGSGF